MLNYSLLTRYGKQLDKNCVLPEYPRPHLRRDSYMNLNGEWDYYIENEKKKEKICGGKIIVPFPIESVLSGVQKTLMPKQVLYLSKTFNINESFIKTITLLHIGAVDQTATVYLNGKLIGSHEGGYSEAIFDISQSIKNGENTLLVCVKDDCSYIYPTGKQRKKRGGIWYTTVSGIWQTVFIESVEPMYVKRIKATPDIDSSVIKLEFDSLSRQFEISVAYDGKTVYSGSVQGKYAEIAIPSAELHLWSPESPDIYDLTVKSCDDEVKSYFAMRKFEAKNGCFYLNNEPYFLNGLLDQGYYSDGIYTPASYDAYKDDILKMKSLGFNTLRKHIKLEPMMFYYYCDTLGMLVLQDMVNVGKYSFFKDTVLPFSGLVKKRPYVNVNKTQKENFIDNALYTVDKLYSFPSVVYYTVFNEGWGQFDGDGVYDLLKKTDNTRVYDATSGWFFENKSDVVSDHIYFKPIKARDISNTSRPWIVSEFGGYSHSIKNHVFNSDREFGYRKYTDISSLNRDFSALYENEILPNIEKGLAGTIYTQLSDVEDETNGILTYDREICKIDKAAAIGIMKRIFNKFKQVREDVSK